MTQARYRGQRAPLASEGWTLEYLTPPSRLYCANGLRTGADGRIYVAQVSGSQISAIEPDTGEIETISPMGSGIVGPDDLAFDDDGNLYATEITEGRVSVRERNGTTRVICGDMPVANPITFHHGRLIAGECRPGARIMELDRNGGAPRVILDNVPMVNAFEVGPDGKLYFPVMGTNEIWRVDLAGGTPEVVACDLAAPDSVKFAPSGYLVSTQAATGQVLRIDPRSGARTVLATIAPGLDNCTFVGERLFVSSISGQINEVLDDGKLRALVPDGLQWPLGLAVDDNGTVFIADGGYTYTLRPGGSPRVAGMLFTPGFPGYTRGVVAAGAGQWVVTTANGAVARYWPEQQRSETLASGFEQLHGVAMNRHGAILFADMATGRLLWLDATGVREVANDLQQPKGVAVSADGACFVSESAARRVVCFAGGKSTTVVDGLGKPEGIAIRDDTLYIVDVGTRELIEHDIRTRVRRTLVNHLPVGAPPGIVPKPLRAFPPLCGAMGPFADVTVAPDGTLYISGDATGAVLALCPARSMTRNH